MPVKFDPAKNHLLLSEERQERMQPEKLLRSLGLRAGHTMADIGCGPGFFTLPAAKIVGARGIVIAADIQGEMLSTVKVRAHEQGLTNVRLLKMNDTSVTLPPRSCDFVLLAFVLHEVPHHATFLHRLERVLKPAGQLVVIEWQKREEEDGPPMADRLAAEELLADAVAAGLRECDFRELGESHYLATFTSAHEDA